MTFDCAGSPADARARLEAVIDARPWNTAGLDGWIRGEGVVLYYRDLSKYRALFRPTFMGRFRQRDGRTVLEGRFGMTWFARALLPVWLAPAVVCLVIALVPTRLEPRITGFRIVLALVGALLGLLALGRFALEWWGRPGDRDAISRAIRTALRSAAKSTP
ncbi:MAG TPA: hypothetical protein VH137_07750 [Gemmatimonadales bacterium]|nr:hypothetical protein [Gemmatimonadales bacterium]